MMNMKPPKAAKPAGKKMPAELLAKFKNKPVRGQRTATNMAKKSK